MLGLIVEKVSGKAFPSFLRDRVFEPLKMTGTVAIVAACLRTSTAPSATRRRPASGRFTDQSATSATLGDEGVYSSIYNLSLWDEALRRHLLFGEADMKAALTPVRVPGKGPTGPGGRPAGLRLRLVPERLGGASADVALRRDGRLPDGHPPLHGRRPRGDRPRQPVGRRGHGPGAQDRGILPWPRRSDRGGQATIEGMPFCRP
ncbi:MAG: serine hydrolase [Sphingobacterium sp.]|nr:serine hydrolase [Sphingobacterium sp.]